MEVEQVNHNNVKDEKSCSKCKRVQPMSCFGVLKAAPDGHRYDCRDCRKMYYTQNHTAILENKAKYWINKRDKIKQQRIQYRTIHAAKYKQVRAEYRQRPRVMEYQRIMNRRRYATNPSCQLRSLISTRIYECLRRYDSKKQHSSIKYLGCDITHYKSWLEFQFDAQMSWSNYGTYWEMDHIIPIARVDISDVRNQYFVFHWTNMQPLTKEANRVKRDDLHLHHYFNNIVNVNRFHSKHKHKQFLGYQAVNESLRWLRIELRDGNNAPYDLSSNVNK